MDVNFSSFFYSASALTDNGANKLRLYYTGSSELDAPFNQPDYIEVLLPTAEQADITVGAAGNDREVQFNNGGSFGASPSLKFTQNSNEGSRLGVGFTPTSTFAIRSNNTSDETNLRISAANGTGINSKGYLTIDQDGTTIAQLGKTQSSTNQEINFISKTPLSLGYTNFSGTTSKKLRVTNQGVAIGAGIDAAALSELSVRGSITIGSALQVADTSYIGPSNIHGNLLPIDAEPTSLLIQSPKGTNGGNVIIGINTDSTPNESFSIVKGIAGSYATDISPIATFKADGNVGINQRNPIEKLHVEGNITGSGNINVKGTGTIQTISELSSLSTDWDGSTEEYARTLVASSTGLVQYMDAAPVPKGGIIMWSGAVNNVPTGWRLCDGTDVNGVAVPDLRERFVVGAGGNNTTNSVTGDPYNVGDVGGTRTHRHGNGGELASDSKSVNYTIPKNGYSIGSIPNSPEDLRIAGYNVVTTARSETGEYLESIAYQNVDRALTSGTHTHTIDVPYSTHLPPYYALAFIIYVGAA